ncbi:hypothetical protein [Piscinibacter sp.]|uniref:hypothetical protein n=1 Tax=Piscinibacter sp. TaxID=1903157 RepID=UPI002F3E4EF1
MSIATISHSSKFESLSTTGAGGREVGHGPGRHLQRGHAWGRQRLDALTQPATTTTPAATTPTTSASSPTTEPPSVSVDPAPAPTTPPTTPDTALGSLVDTYA